MKNETLSEKIAKWVTNLQYDDIPTRVLEKSKLQMMSIIASSLAGSKCENSRRIYDTVMKWKNFGDVTIIPNGDRTSLHDALLVNSAYSMALDYDDYLFMGHTGHSAVFASLMMGEKLDRGGKEVLLSQIVGNEVGGRLGASVILGPHNGQLWSFIHSLSSACASAKIMGLDFEKTVNAIGISLYQPNFPLYPGFMGADSKILTASFPILNGVMAAQFAEEGLTGSREILDHERGFPSYFSYHPFYSMLTGWGRSWVTDTINVKKYPGCAYISTTMDALFEILEEYGGEIDPSEIERVDVEASMLTTAMNGLAEEFFENEDISQVNVNFSIPYSIAVGLLEGKLESYCFHDDFLEENREKILELSKKVTLKHDLEFSLEVLNKMGEHIPIADLFSDVSYGEMKKVREGVSSKITPKEIIGLLGGVPRSEMKIVRDLIVGKLKKSLKIERETFDQGFDLGNIDFSGFEMPFPAKVVLQLKDGSSYGEERKVPRGSSSRDDFEGVVENKFLREVRPFLGKEKTEEVMNMIKNFEDFSAKGLVKGLIQ